MNTKIDNNLFKSTYLMKIKIFKAIVITCLALHCTHTIANEVNINGLTVAAQVQNAIQPVIASVAGNGGGIALVINVDEYGNRMPYNATAALSLNIPDNVTLVWDLEYSSSGTFQTGLINISGDGAFVISENGSLVRSGPNETLTVSGAGATVTVYGTVSANSARAIHLTGTNSTVIVDGGLVSTNSTIPVQAAIYVENTGNTGTNVIVKGNGKVFAEAAGGYAILSYGNVEINDNAEISAHDGGVAIDALGANSTVTVNGGTVSTTGGNSGTAIGGSAIVCHYGKIVINGGTVSATTGKAIHTVYSGGAVEINGGTVSATTGYAIRNDNVNSTITVNGGFVFAYGTGITGTSPDVNFVTNRAPNTVTNGVLAAWNTANQGPFLAFDNLSLQIYPLGAAVWYDDGTGGGIAFVNGDNAGFFPVGVAVNALQPDENGVLYVDINGAGNGSSWTLAYSNLADPLIYAARQRAILLGSPNNLIRQIWIAEGEYKPMYSAEDYNFTNKIFPGATETPRNYAFVLAPDLIIYGGFEPANIPPDNPLPFFKTTGRNGTTTLSGNLGASGNTYHVVISADDVGTSILDGITISGGNADGTESITVNNQQIFQNSGGGMYNIFSSPSLNNVSIINNNAATNGGGMYNEMSSAAMINTIISGNSAEDSGGGIYNEASFVTMTNVLISGNSTTTDGGGMFNSNSSPTLINVTVSGNMAGGMGGGIDNDSSNPLIVNSIIWGNSTIGSNNDNIGSFGNPKPAFSYSIIEGSRSSGAWNNNLGTDNGNNLDSKPEFEDPKPAAEAPTTAGDYRLKLTSLFCPAVDAGDRTANVSITDLAGEPRIIGSGIDIGAYERQEGERIIIPKPTENVLYVDHSKDGDGSSWEEAYKDFSLALLYAAMHQAGVNGVLDTEKIIEIRVAEGTYIPRFTFRGYNFDEKIFPDVSDGTYNSFVLAPRVKIFGGFVPNQLDYPEQLPAFGEKGRDGNTLLSGNLSSGVNANHVVIAVNIPNEANTVVDGVTISYGNALIFGHNLVNKEYINTQRGGGIHLINSSPTLSNVTISENKAIGGGGGIYSYNSSPLMINVRITGNSTEGQGGGMSCDTGTGYSPPTLINAVISGNHANRGGGMYYFGRAPVHTNVTISGNRATSNGGGIESWNSEQLTFKNSIIWGNIADVTDDNVYVSSGNAPSFSNSIIGDDRFSGNGNINANPHFVMPFDATDAPTTAGGYTLRWYSPAINRGSNAAYLEARQLSDEEDFDNEIDHAGRQRLFDGKIDIGAYEFHELVPTANAGIIYVAENATGSGASWNFAFPNLAQPLLYAAMQKSGYVPVMNPNERIVEIRMAEGTYYPMFAARGINMSDGFGPIIIPSNDGSQENSFVLVPDVKIYGGFVPDDLLNHDDIPPFGEQGKGRDGETILSGDLAKNDVKGDFSNSIRIDNVQNVIICAGNTVGFDIGNETLLDGLTISGGNVIPTFTPITVNGTVVIEADGGGGIHIAHASPTLINLTVSDNITTSNGGGISNISSSPLLNNVVISGNRAGYAGGMFNNNSNPVLNNVVISGNEANYGGGMHNTSSNIGMNNVKIENNIANQVGGGIYTAVSSSIALTNSIISGNSATTNGGGVYSNDTDMTLVNVLISENEAEAGGGMYFDTNVDDVRLTNVTISGNSATNSGGGIFSNATEPIRIENSIIWGNTQSGAFIDVDGNITNESSIIHDIIGTDPNFGSGYRLQDGSPAINHGNDALYLSARGITNFDNEIDLAGNPRHFGTHIDMGAYEYQIIQIESVALEITVPVTLQMQENPITVLTIDEGFSIQDRTWEPNDSPFKGGIGYFIYINLRPETMYSFANTLVATINGVNAIVTHNGDGTVTVYRPYTTEFLEQAPLYIVDHDPKTYGDAPFYLSTIGGSTGGTVTYSLISGPATINESTGMVTITGVGDIVVTAKMYGDQYYNDVISDEYIIPVFPLQLHKTVPTVNTEKPFDGNSNATAIAGTLINAVPGDDVTVTIVSATFNSPNVDDANIITIVYGISGSDAGKYIVPENFTIAGNITKEPVISEKINIFVNGELTTRDDDNFMDYSLPLPCDEDKIEVFVETENILDEISINGIWENPRFVYLSELPEWGDNAIEIVVRSPYHEGHPYTLIYNKPVPFNEMIVMRWNNRLTVVNNPANNAVSARFTDYHWHRNDELILSGQGNQYQSYTAGADGSPLSPDDSWYVEVNTLNAMTQQNTLYRTCIAHVTLRNISFRAYPNPVETGQSLIFEADIAQANIDGAVIEVYNVLGVLVDILPVQGQQTIATINYSSGLYVFVLKDNKGERMIELKVTIKN